MADKDVGTVKALQQIRLSRVITSRKGKPYTILGLNCWKRIFTPINDEITYCEPCDGCLVCQGGVPEEEELYWAILTHRTLRPMPLSCVVSMSIGQLCVM